MRFSRQNRRSGERETTGQPLPMAREEKEGDCGGGNGRFAPRVD
jgi:hypothetical protein